MPLPQRKVTLPPIEQETTSEKPKPKPKKSKEDNGLNGGLTRKLSIPRSCYDENGRPSLEVDIDGLDLTKSIGDFL